MSEENEGIMSHKRFLELQKSNEPMSIITAKLFMEHPRECKECLEEAKKSENKN